MISNINILISQTGHQYLKYANCFVHKQIHRVFLISWKQNSSMLKYSLPCPYQQWNFYDEIHAIFIDQNLVSNFATYCNCSLQIVCSKNMPIKIASKHVWQTKVRRSGGGLQNRRSMNQLR